MAEIYSASWSEAAEDNDANFPDGWQGGTTFPHIPPTGREMMAAIKREWAWSRPVYTAGGGATTWTLTPAGALPGYADSLIVAGKTILANLHNSLFTVLNVSGKGSREVFVYSRTGLVPTYGFIPIIAGMPFLVYYDSTLDSGTGGFVLFSQPALEMLSEDVICPITSESGAAAAGVGKFTFRLPYAFLLTGVSASLQTAQTSGNIITIDVNIDISGSATSILSTKLTIDNGEKTSATAATPVSLNNFVLFGNDDSEITIDVDQIGDGTARGLKVTLVGYQR